MVSPLKPAIGGYAGPTTSAQLRALITDALGTGPLMFQGAALGAAMATSLTLTSAGAAAPPLNFSGAPLSGLYDGGANAVGIATNGKPALLVLESGAAGTYVSIFSNNTPSVLAAGLTNVGLQLSGSGIGGVDLMTNALNQYIARFNGPGATAANYPVFAATAAGAGPSMTATGSDTNIDLNFAPKGTGLVKIAGGLQIPNGVLGTPSISFGGSPSSGLYYNSFVAIQVSGKDALRVSASGTSNNYISIVSNNGPTITAVEGSGGNVVLTLQSAGTSGIDLKASGGGFFLRTASGTGTPVNYLQIQNGQTGVSPSILSQGTDTDIDLIVQSKGAGLVRFSTASNIVANGAVATTMTSLGPTGSHTTIQEWLAVKNVGGTIRYIPLY